MLRASLAGMRIVVLIAASVLVAGVFERRSRSVPTVRSRRPTHAVDHPHRTTGRPRTTTGAAPAKAPVAGAPIADVISWIEAGTARRRRRLSLGDARRRDDATRRRRRVRHGGHEAELHDEPVRRRRTGMPGRTDQSAAAARRRLRQWKSGWVDFGGTSVEIGSAHGDPGRFGNGIGPELPDGQTLAFGDYRCRADPSGTVLRELCAPVGGEVRPKPASNRSAACRRSPRHRTSA